MKKVFLINQGSEEFCIMSSERENESTCYLKVEQSINIISRVIFPTLYKIMGEIINDIFYNWNF